MTIDPKTIDIGTIFYSSWGYEQTNISFYQLVRKSGKTALYLRKLHNEIVSGDGWGGKVQPKKDHFKGEEFRKILRSPKDGIMHDSEYIQLWDGVPKAYTAYH